MDGCHGVLCYDGEQGVGQQTALRGPGKGCMEEECHPKRDDAVEGLPGELEEAQSCTAHQVQDKGSRHCSSSKAAADCQTGHCAARMRS